MNQSSQVFLLDANVFIEAHRRYYSFDICPGFWNMLLHYNDNSRIFSIDRVKEEMESGDELGKWIKDSVPKKFFCSTDENKVSQQYFEIMQWVQSSVQFKEQAKTDFAQGADGWLISFAKVYGHTVVTHETYNPYARRKVSIPNICQDFNVEYSDTFAMLRKLNVRFNWEKP
jgi:hypothetical protein